MNGLRERQGVYDLEEEEGSNGSWYFGGAGRDDGQTTSTPSLRSEERAWDGQHPERYSQQRLQQSTPLFTPQFIQQSTPVQRWVEQSTPQQQQKPQVATGLGFVAPGTTAYLQEALFNRSTTLSAIDCRGRSRTIGEEELKNAMRKALRREYVLFRSEEHKEVLQTVVSRGQTMPLVVVLPTGGRKSLLFMAPACLDDPGVTIVVVPYRALLDNLLAAARKAGINCLEYRPGE